MRLTGQLRVIEAFERTAGLDVDSYVDEVERVVREVVDHAPPDAAKAQARLVGLR